MRQARGSAGRGESDSVFAWDSSRESPNDAAASEAILQKCRRFIVDTKLRHYEKFFKREFQNVFKK